MVSGLPLFWSQQTMKWAAIEVLVDRHSRRAHQDGGLAGWPCIWQNHADALC